MILLKVEKGKLVKVEYTGTFDDGTVFDSTDMHGGEPLAFVAGVGQMISGFDKNVIGMDVGDTKKFRLEPNEAYGERDPNATDKISKDQFPKDQEPEVGMMLRIMQAHGEHSHQLLATITEINEDDVTIDLNHPMAGKPLNFDIKVVDVSECESECGPGCSCDHEH